MSRYTLNDWRGMAQTLVDQLSQCARLVSEDDKEFFAALEEANDMLDSPPPPVQKFPTFKTDKRWVYRNVGKKQGSIRDVIVAECIVGGNGRAQAYRNARLFAAAPRLLNACRAALLRDDIADCELGDELRAAIAATEQ